MPVSIHQNIKNKNTFCQVSVYTKANDGKKEIGSTYSFIVVCCQYWLSRVRPDRISHPRLPRLFLSHRSCVLSQRDSRYWYCNNSHTTVSAENTLSIITLSTLLYLLLFLTARCINAPVSKHVTLSQFKIEFVSRACCSTSRCTFSWRNVY